MSSIATVAIPTYRQRLSYYIELTKPRILIMILLTVAMAFVAVPTTVSLYTLLNACVGTALIAASASVLNQWLEQERDKLMMRTCKRPLPSGRVASSQAAWMGWALVIVGAVYLGYFVNWPTLFWGLLTWGLYVWVYTPLKMVSWTNTLVGTIPGALPVWMGWTASGGSVLEPYAWVLLGILVAWQLPHFMAIAKMYQPQYEAAGYRMITVTDKTGRGAAWHAMLGAIALVPLAFLAIPPVNFWAGLLCALIVGLGAWQTKVAWRFAIVRDHATARAMLYVSLFYLPLTMLLISISFWVGRS
jgi:protoheme IX farnesyltransferase